MSRCFKPGVVEIENGVAVAAYALEGEQPGTIWLGGTITVKPDGGGGPMRAWHKGKPLN